CPTCWSGPWSWSSSWSWSFPDGCFVGLRCVRRALRGYGVDRHSPGREIHHLRRSGGEQFGQPRTRRINSDGGYLARGRLRPPSAVLQLRIPAARENRGRRPEIEAHHVGRLVVGLGRQAQEIGGRVVAGEGAEPDGELKGHRCNVAELVGGDPGGIAGRK